MTFFFCCPALFASDTVTIPPVQAAKSGAKSENKALRLSLISTFAPAAAAIPVFLTERERTTTTLTVGLSLAGAGLYLGPSTGYFYGGCASRGWKGIGVRTAIGAATAALIVAAVDKNAERTNEVLLIASLAAGGGLFIASAVRDLSAVKWTVRKHNESFQKTGWQLAPKYFAGHKTPGLQLQITF